MKKLMMAVVAAIATIGAASAATTWSIGFNAPGDSMLASAGTIYAVFVENPTKDNFKLDTQVDRIRDAFTAKVVSEGIDLTTLPDLQVMANDTTYNVHVVGSKDFVKGKTGTWSAEYTYTGDAGITKAAGWGLVVATGEQLGIEGDDNLYICGNGTGRTNLSYTGISFGNDNSKSLSNWSEYSPSPIPEPTSGLLMLLGMAGLALKRKRA